jgi:ribonuclease Z
MKEVEMRRRLVAILAALLLMHGAVGCSKMQDRMIQREMENSIDRSYFDDGKMHIILCGTGSPIPDPNRRQSCVAIIVDGQIMLVDTGDGAAYALQLLKLPIDLISNIFITHFHSDHIADLGQVINRSWIFGRKQPIEIYGPEGIRQIVDGFEQVYALDAGYRVDHHGDAMRLENRTILTRMVAFENPDEAVTLFNENDLKISSFMVEHSPVEPAVGYRFDYKGKVLVISGDTIANSNVERYSKDAGILIHSVMNKDLNSRVATLLQAADAENFQRGGKMLEDTLSYQTDAPELGKLAQRAGVKKLVLTHLVPPPRNFIVTRAFKNSVGEHYKGELIVGEDHMHLEL